jgi:hypothetical protein
MGADIVGWITCPLQRGLGREAFSGSSNLLF